MTLVPCPPAACPRGARRDIAIPHLALPRPPGLIYGGARMQSRPRPPRTRRQRLLRCILTRSRRQARRLHANGSQSQPGPAALGDAAGPLPGRWISALVPGGCSRQGGGAGCASANGDVVLGELQGTHRATCSHNGAVRNAIPWGRVPSISKLQWEEGGTVGDGTKWPYGTGMCVHPSAPAMPAWGQDAPGNPTHTLCIPPGWSHPGAKQTSPQPKAMVTSNRICHQFLGTCQSRGAFDFTSRGTPGALRSPALILAPPSPERQFPASGWSLFRLLSPDVK